MRIAISAAEASLDAPVSSIFGRCPVLLFVDTDTLAFEAVENPALGAFGGAGVQSAQLVVQKGAKAVITGNVGPNAFHVLKAAGVSVYLRNGGTVREAVEALAAGTLLPIADPNVAAHSGIGGGTAATRGKERNT